MSPGTVGFESNCFRPPVRGRRSSEDGRSTSRVGVERKRKRKRNVAKRPSSRLPYSPPHTTRKNQKIKGERERGRKQQKSSLPLSTEEGRKEEEGDFFFLKLETTRNEPSNF